MKFTFFLDDLKGRKYKKIFQRLCNISNVIYFSYYEDLIYNDQIFQLGEKCEQVDVPRRIRDRVYEDMDIIGYRVDIFIKQYIYSLDSALELIGDREYGSILFYNDEKVMAHIQLNDFREIEFFTNDKVLEEVLSAIK